MKKYTVTLENAETGKRVTRTYEASDYGALATIIKAKLKKAGQKDKWRIVGWEV